MNVDLNMYLYILRKADYFTSMLMSLAFMLSTASYFKLF